MRPTAPAVEATRVAPVLSLRRRDGLIVRGWEALVELGDVRTDCLHLGQLRVPVL